MKPNPGQQEVPDNLGPQLPPDEELVSRRDAVGNGFAHVENEDDDHDNDSDNGEARNSYLLYNDNEDDNFMSFNGKNYLNNRNEYDDSNNFYDIVEIGRSSRSRPSNWRRNQQRRRRNQQVNRRRLRNRANNQRIQRNPYNRRLSRREAESLRNRRRSSHRRRQLKRRRINANREAQRRGPTRRYRRLRKRPNANKSNNNQVVRYIQRPVERIIIRQV